jgi:hypothetical protein
MAQDYRHEDRFGLAVSKLIESPETDIELSREVFWKLKSEYANCTNRIARWSLYMFGSAFLFLLLNKNIVGSASIVGIQVDRLAFLTYFLPPIVGFCWVNITAAADEQWVYEHLMVYLAKAKLPGLHASEICVVLTSNNGLLGSDIPSAFMNRLGKFNNALYVGTQTLIGVVFYLSFEIYAYIYLFGHSEEKIGTIVSLFAAVSFLVMTVLRFIALVSDSVLPARFI